GGGALHEEGVVAAVAVDDQRGRGRGADDVDRVGPAAGADVQVLDGVVVGDGAAAAADDPREHRHAGAADRVALADAAAVHDVQGVGAGAADDADAAAGHGDAVGQIDKNDVVAALGVDGDVLQGLEGDGVGGLAGERRGPGGQGGGVVELVDLDEGAVLARLRVEDDVVDVGVGGAGDGDGLAAGRDREVAPLVEVPVGG